MKNIYTAEDIREAEKPYISAPDYDGYLMQAAAQALADEVHEYLSLDGEGNGPSAKRLLLLVGPGNNGADTIWAGSRLSALGYRIDVLLTDREGANLELCVRESKEGTRILGAHWAENLNCESLEEYDLIIDGILGTGARGAARGHAGQILTQLRAMQLAGDLPPVIACDMPTGIDAHTGMLHEPVLRAIRTVTFIGLKLPYGTSTAQACGDIKLYDLGVPEALDMTFPHLVELEPEDYREEIFIPDAHSHKYTRGVLGILAGSDTYPGAGIMLTRAAINTGVGMARYGYPSEAVRSLLLASCPEAVTFGTGSSEHIPTQHVDAWAIGSGLEFNSTVLEAFERILDSDTPAIIDAAALDATAAYLGRSDSPLGAEKILTPHAGELARFFTVFATENPTRWRMLHESDLADSPFRDPVLPGREDIEAEPGYWVRLGAWVSGATVLLKGGYSLIAGGCGENIYRPETVNVMLKTPIFSVTGGTPWLATAGSGDTLTGILGTLLAQLAARAGSLPQALEYSPTAILRCAALGVYLHGQAALASLDGRLGPVPGSIVNRYLPHAVAELIR